LTAMRALATATAAAGAAAPPRTHRHADAAVAPPPLAVGRRAALVAGVAGARCGACACVSGPDYVVGACREHMRGKGRTLQAAAASCFFFFFRPTLATFTPPPITTIPHIPPSPRTHTRTHTHTPAALAAAAAAAPPQAAALPPGFKKDLTPKRRQAIPETAFKEGPRGLKYADLKAGAGPEARQGDRVVVHYEAKWRGVTFMTSRQGLGVTGGTPLGFDVGAQGAGGTLAGLDLGVRGMRVGGRRVLQVPPELAYGKAGVGEIPPNATITIDCELLSVKNSPLGYRTKLVEG